MPLGDADAPEMLALATLTEPGPFHAHTHSLGDFVGIRVGGRLAAMAGERMKLPGFTEVSAVCTHPDFRGRGYAGALMRVVIGGILARGETPILHSYATNRHAIALYESLGFRTRAELVFTVLAR
ncbi:MAG: GNAT family N-acetyltransferase [Sphingomonas sp.]